MTLAIVWRNTRVPQRLKPSVEQLQSARPGTHFIARSARTVRIFEVLPGGTACNPGPDFWVDLPRSSDRHVEVIEL
jgi:hypothetical protein